MSISTTINETDSHTNLLPSITMKITIFGATGNTGPPLVRTLLTQEAVKRVRVVVSSTETERFQRAGFSGISDDRFSIVVAKVSDPNDFDKLVEACEGSDVVSMANTIDDRLFEYDKRCIDAAMKAGTVKRIMHIVAGMHVLHEENNKSFVPGQLQVRMYLRQLDMQTVTISPSYFQNSMLYFVYALVFQNRFIMPFDPSKVSFNFINAKDIAKFIASVALVSDEVFEERAVTNDKIDLSSDGDTKLAGKHWDVEICGPERIPFSAWVGVVKDVSGGKFADIKFDQVDGQEFEQYMSQGLPPKQCTLLKENHLYIGKLGEDIEADEISPEVLGLVEGLSPKSSEDLIKLKDFVKDEFLPVALYIQSKVGGDGEK